MPESIMVCLHLLFKHNMLIVHDEWADEDDTFDIAADMHEFSMDPRIDPCWIQEKIHKALRIEVSKVKEYSGRRC